MNKENKKIYLYYLATEGLIILSLAPIFCNGNICQPINVPDMPSRGNFLYDRIYDTPYNIQNIQTSANISIPFISITKNK